MNSRSLNLSLIVLPIMPTSLVALPISFFTDHHHEPYDWPDDIMIGSNEQQPAPYPDLPDNVPGVQILCQENVPLPSLSSRSDDQD